MADEWDTPNPSSKASAQLSSVPSVQAQRKDYPSMGCNRIMSRRNRRWASSSMRSRRSRAISWNKSASAAALQVASIPLPPVSPLLRAQNHARGRQSPPLRPSNFCTKSEAAWLPPIRSTRVLDRIVDFACSVISCDSCFVYVLEDNQLVLRASKNPHSDVVDHLGIWLGQGITGWVGWHREPVAILPGRCKIRASSASRILPEDTFEAFLSVPILCRGKLVGVINLQHRKPYHTHVRMKIVCLPWSAHLVGAELEMARLETENFSSPTGWNRASRSKRPKECCNAILASMKTRPTKRCSGEPAAPQAMREIAEAIVLNNELARTVLAKSPRRWPARLHLKQRSMPRICCNRRS